MPLSLSQLDADGCATEGLGLGDKLPGAASAFHSRHNSPIPPGLPPEVMALVHSLTLAAKSQTTSPFVRLNVLRWLLGLEFPVP